MEYFKNIKRKHAELVSDLLISSIQDATDMPRSSCFYAKRFLTCLLMERFSNLKLIETYEYLKNNCIGISEFFEFIDDFLYFYEN